MAAIAPVLLPEMKRRGYCKEGETGRAARGIVGHVRDDPVQPRPDHHRLGDRPSYKSSQVQEA
jgi:hypothetical protein